MFLPLKMNRIELCDAEFGSDGSRIRSDGFACLIRDNESGRRTGPVRSGHRARQAFGRLVSLYLIKDWGDCAGMSAVAGKENSFSLNAQNLTADNASSKTAGLPLASFTGSDRIWRKRRAPGKPLISPSMWRVMPCIFRPLLP